MKLKTSVKNIETQYTILSICNGAYYGGGFNIAPKSTLTDGLLDVYYAEKMSKIKMKSKKIKIVIQIQYLHQVQMIKNHIIWLNQQKMN